MEEKIYDIYQDNEKKGRLKVYPSIIKKVISLSVATVIGVTTMAGCSFTNKKEANKETSINSNQYISVNTFDSLEEEIEVKKEFINNVLQSLRESGAEPTYDRILNNYKTFADYEFDIDPMNEYSMFLTEEEKHDKKRAMINELNEMIRLTETLTEFRFNKDFIKTSYGSK